MADPGELLQERIDALVRISARIPGGIAGLTAAQDADVLAVLESAQQLVLSAQGVVAAAAGEVARRSAGNNDASLARRLGQRSARGLVAATTGTSFGEASRLVAVGEAIRPNVALSGEDLPPDRRHIAGAVLEGRLSLPLALLIDETISTVRGRLLLDEADELERSLVAAILSGSWSVADFTAYCRRIPDLLDPDGAKPREEALRAKASVRETWLDNGMLRIVAELDPESAAFYLAAVRAKTNPRRGAAAQQEPGLATVGARKADQPTPAQSKLHAFVTIMRNSLKADDGVQAGVDTTVLVRIELQDLLSGIGSATIDGVGQPITASAARRLAAEGDLIPQVFDGASVLLDQGKSKRLFTKAQRYAILSMFSGCAFPKCDLPSAMTEIHHVGSWATRHDHDQGTDLLNGIPLCGFHNRLMEQDWEIRFDEHRVPWFVPPPHVDVFQRPVRGGGLADRRAA